MEKEIFNQASYIGYLLAKLLKFVQINTLTFSDSFLQRIPWKLKGPATSFQAIFFLNFFGKIFSFVILHKLAKFHYQTVFTSQVIHQYLLRVSCLCIWWPHDIWILEKIKFDYLKNEKSFRNEMKNIFPCFTNPLFSTYKTN